ncbi:MAG: hypothetical protein NC212_10970 [Staphylococcus sp.]|nr:hypothetical protein [Staphylococcus sp.]
MKHLKEEFDKLTFKEVLVYTLAVLAKVAGVVLLFLGMYIPPEGQIHASVLSAFGMICVFSASLLGISIHYANELSKFKTTVAERLESMARKEVAG